MVVARANISEQLIMLLTQTMCLFSIEVLVSMPNYQFTAAIVNLLCH
jgi:hypothetical protein